MAYERLYGPLGASRADYHAALVAAVVAAVNTDPKKAPPPLSDFMPDWEQMSREAARGDDT